MTEKYFTLCWNCSKRYPMLDAICPGCGEVNGNDHKYPDCAVFRQGVCTCKDNPASDAGIFKWDKVSKCFHPQYEKYALDSEGALLPGFVRLYTAEQLKHAYAEGRKDEREEWSGVVDAASKLYDAWLAFAQPHPQNDGIEKLEWGEFRNLRIAITKARGA